MASFCLFIKIGLRVHNKRTPISAWLLASWTGVQGLGAGLGLGFWSGLGCRFKVSVCSLGSGRVCV